MKLEAFAETFNAAHQEHFGKPASRNALELAYGHFVGASLCVTGGNATPTDFAANGNELVFAVR